MSPWSEGSSISPRAYRQRSKRWLLLKPGAPFVFTYHHNTIAAYFPVAVALLDAGLTCSASIPCPAEMGASIHINGTGSSIVDTVFVCRAQGVVPRSTIVDDMRNIARLVERDVRMLQAAGLTPTQGDMRCIAHGHLVRLAIWNLRRSWTKETLIKHKLALVEREIRRLGDWQAISQHLSTDLAQVPLLQTWAVHEATVPYETGESDVDCTGLAQFSP